MTSDERLAAMTGRTKAEVERAYLLAQRAQDAAPRHKRRYRHEPTPEHVPKSD